jgi:hypothetical protein
MYAHICKYIMCLYIYTQTSFTHSFARLEDSIFPVKPSSKESQTQNVYKCYGLPPMPTPPGQVRIHVCAYLQVCMYYMHGSMYILHIYMYACVCIYIYTHTYIHTHIFMRAHSAVYVYVTFLRCGFGHF